MSDEDALEQGRPVPGSRFSRMARFGGLATGVAGEALVNRAKSFARGEKPQIGDLLLTPSNVARVAEQLSQLRGAAMKVGQMLSMDAGEVLPPELAEILARLRESAYSMPGRQLKTVLNDNWGHGWLKRFASFDVNPIAAASIGQVHRARTKDGRDLAVKVQYPGVRESIDSDVDNVAMLIRLSGLVPKSVDMTSLLDEAKRQLHQEADYEQEARSARRFALLLESDVAFEIPAIHDDLTTPSVLAMSFVDGAPLESLADASQDVRNAVVARLFDLVFRELFEFGLMQTDPNFANYRHRADDGRILLLDFGATRSFSRAFAEKYQRLLKAGLDDDREAIDPIIRDIGFYGPDVEADVRDVLVTMFYTALAPLRAKGPFDFGDAGLAEALREAAFSLRVEAGFRYIPPTDVLYLHRKFAGLYLLASRLKANVDCRKIAMERL